MKLKQSLLVAGFALAGIASTQAQKFSLSGEFRPRTELGGNGGPFTNTPATPGGNTAAVGSEAFIKTSVRAALKATYTTDSYTVFTSFQEVFFLGDRPQISAGGNGNLRVQEAWADLKLGEYASLKIGRQPLSYDDQRILGGLGWAQQARTHDAVVYKYSKDGYNLDLGASLNTYAGTVYPTANLFSYRDMGFLRVNKKYGGLNISLLGLVNTYQAGTENKSTLTTAGIHADYKVGGLGLHLNAFIQDGQRAGDVTVDGAYLASLDADYKLDKVTLGLGYETISGRTDDSAAFFPLYGTNHKFNGLMDRFYVGNNGNAGGLNDFHASVATKIAGAAVSLKGHIFTEVEDVATAPGSNTGAVGLDGKDLGSELDLVVAKGFKGYKVVGGYSQFFEPDGVSAQGAQNWAWVMLIIAPKFL
ncbi:alginate export family protein [Wenyingzhuangia sp. IMCC45574]